MAVMRRAGPFSLRYSRYLPRCAAGRHAHGEARIALPLHGWFETKSAGRLVQVGTGGALYRPANDEHEDVYHDAMDCVTVLLPDQLGLPVTGHAQAMNDPRLHRAAIGLQREATASDVASNLIIEGLALLVSCILVSAMPRADSGVSRWVARVREQLRDCDGPPPSLSELAHSVGRDPAYVAATFKRVYGMTVGDYVRRLRLWRVWDALDRNCDSKLSELAADCGFADQSHFTRHFRRMFGVTPGSYRVRRLRASA
ncbi:MAG: helix-turn-helix domain-containing protein [Rhizomicrobium sp.]